MGSYIWRDYTECVKCGNLFEEVRVEKANIDMPDLPAQKLEQLVAREQLMSRILPLIKHPCHMIKKYLSYFKKDHRIVFNFILKNISQSIKKKQSADTKK